MTAARENSQRAAARRTKQRAIELARTGRFSGRRGGTGKLVNELGIKSYTYARWRDRDKNWAAQFDAALKAAKPEPVGNYDGTFPSFRQVFLGMETTWFQARIIEEILAARPGEVVLILIPPAHGKTTLLEDYCTWKLAEDPTYRITVASETVDHGEKIVSRVRDRFEDEGPNPAIPRRFGKFAPVAGDKAQVWSQRRFNVRGKLAASGERDYSMSCVGLTGRVQGTRCDLLLLDDMQDVKSLELSKKYFDIVTQSFLSRPEMFGRTVIIGTRVGRDDVYQRLMQAQIHDKLVMFPAYTLTESVEWPQPLRKPKLEDESTWAPQGVKFLWPEKYDDTTGFEDYRLKDLHRFRYAKLRHQLGEQTWWRIYMQAPEIADNMTFDEATTDAMKDEHRSIKGDPRPITATHYDDKDRPSLVRPVPVPVLIGVDPSIGGGNGIVAAAGYPRLLEVLNCRLDFSLTKYSQIIDLIEEECHRWSTPDSIVTAVIVEDKAFQRGLLKDERLEEVQRHFGFRIVPNTTNREKADPDIGVRGMPLPMIRREITIPWGDNRSIEVMTPLLDQLHLWQPGKIGRFSRPGHSNPGAIVPQDLVMALWFVWRYWRATCQDTATHSFRGDPSTEFRGSSSPLRPPTHRGRRRRPAYGGVSRWH